MRRRRWTWLACALAVLGAAFAQAPLGAAEGGAGATPPTAVRYADPAWYDLVDVRWAVDEVGRPVALELELAAVDPERPLLQPILEAYLMVEEGGRGELLPGSGVPLADGQRWSVAIRVTEQGAWAWLADGGAPGRSLDVAIDGRVVRLAWPADLPVEGRWAALSGVYDPFHAAGWRAFAREPSPWTFATADPGPPVADVFPGDGATLAQVQAGRPWSPRRSAPLRAPVSPWWWWMAGGLALAVAGLVWRRMPSPDPPPDATSPLPSTVELIDDDEVASAAAPPTVATGAAVPPSIEAASEAVLPAVEATSDGGTEAPADATRDATSPGADPFPPDGRSARASRYEPEERPATGTGTAASDEDAPTSSAPSSRTTRAPSEARRPAKRS